jgi:hypothetical protein
VSATLVSKTTVQKNNQNFSQFSQTINQNLSQTIQNNNQNFIQSVKEDFEMNQIRQYIKDVSAMKQAMKQDFSDVKQDFSDMKQDLSVMKADIAHLK